MRTAVDVATEPPLTFEEEARIWREWVTSRPPRDPVRRLGERNLARAGLLGFAHQVPPRPHGGEPHGRDL